MWSLPRKIKKAAVSQLNMDSTAKVGKMGRRRPLQTCGASFLFIAHNVCIKAQEFDGPIGSMAKRAVKISDLFLPFVYSILYPWLGVLSFMDDRILSVENMVEKVFPLSKCLFDKIDELVTGAEVLPQKFDDACRRFPMVMHRFPFLDWVLAHLISWLNFILSCLTHWGSKSTREKEITVDVNCNGNHSTKPEVEEKLVCCRIESLDTDKSDYVQEKLVPEGNHIAPSTTEEPEKSSSSREKANDHVETNDLAIPKSIKTLCSLEKKAVDETAESPMYAAYKSALSSPTSDFAQDEAHSFGQSSSSSDAIKCTYKEMLERGTQEERFRQESTKSSINAEKARVAEDCGKYREDGSIIKDQILKLFDESWHSK